MTGEQSDTGLPQEVVVDECRDLWSDFSRLTRFMYRLKFALYGRCGVENALRSGLPVEKQEERIVQAMTDGIIEVMARA